MNGKDAILGVLIVLFFGGVSWGLLQFGSAETDRICTGNQCIVPLPPANSVSWPPKMGEPYPDVEFINEDGQTVRLSSYKGSVLLIEPIGMTCSACQAFSGAHRYGSYNGIVPQRGLASIEELVPQYASGVPLADDRIVFIQILLYNMSMDAPTAGDVRKWSDHFKMDRSDNYIVLAGTDDLMGPASYEMIPGFQLVDQDFILRSDSTGHNPRDNLYTELLPMLPALL